jgi:hypothetical protein
MNVAVSVVGGTAAVLLIMKMARTGQAGRHWMSVEKYTVLLNFTFIAKLLCDL